HPNLWCWWRAHSRLKPLLQEGVTGAASAKWVPADTPDTDSRSDGWSNCHLDRRERSAFPQIPRLRLGMTTMKHGMRIRMKAPADACRSMRPLVRVDRGG